MKAIPLFEIKVEDRQRREFDEMAIFDLSEDIREHGLIHAIVVTPSNHLIAGERRLRALKLLHSKGLGCDYMGEHYLATAPCAVLPESDPIKLKEIELSENLQRVDLTWQERARATAELHELRAQQNKTPQTLSDTAREIRRTEDVPASALTEVRDSLALAKHLNDPEIKRAKTRKEAVKLLRLKNQREEDKRRAEEFKTTPSASPHRLIHGEAIAELAKMPESFVDVLLTDPPYGVGAHTFGNQTAINHHYDDSPHKWLELMQGLAEESFRVCKPQAHAYVFCDIRRWRNLAALFDEAGWDVWSRPLIWYKGNIGTLPRPEHGPRLTYEAILYAIKGDRKTLCVAHDVLTIPTTAKPRHAAEKPVALYLDLLRRSARPGAVILDPFCGSGTIFPAGNFASCRTIGVELDDAAYGIASQRIDEAPGSELLEVLK